MRSGAALNKGAHTVEVQLRQGKPFSFNVKNASCVGSVDLNLITVNFQRGKVGLGLSFGYHVRGSVDFKNRCSGGKDFAGFKIGMAISDGPGNLGHRLPAPCRTHDAISFGLGGYVLRLGNERAGRGAHFRLFDAGRRLGIGHEPGRGANGKQNGRQDLQEADGFHSVSGP